MFEIFDDIEQDVAETRRMARRLLRCWLIGLGLAALGLGLFAAKLSGWF